MKTLGEFELDGKPVYVEIEDDFAGVRRVGRTEDGILKTEIRFAEAIAQIRPAAEAVLSALREMNTPDEIGLEFGVKFNAKAGAFFASAASEAAFKVSLKWKNEKK
ncbi:MAG: CU044_2847 family protein [Desulfobacterales bacterium]